MNSERNDDLEFVEYEDSFDDPIYEDDEVGYFLESDEDPAWHRADERWEIPWYQSWLILLVLMIVYLSFTVLIYWFEPGIR